MGLCGNKDNGSEPTGLASIFIPIKQWGNMPTKKMFDLVLITALLLHGAMALPKMWAARKAAEGNGGLVDNAASAVIGVVA